MSVLKQKGEALYQKLKLQREQLVKKYEAGGTIRYDEAIGLIPVGGNPAQSTAATTLGGAQVVNTGRREKRVPDHREDGVVAATNGRVVLDLDAIKAANIADGIPSGTMMDALKKRAEGKTILLFPDDAALRYGTIILGEVKCQLKLMGDIVNAIRNAVFPGFQASNTTLNGVLNTGLAHALPGFVEQESLTHRGFPKPVNYRGDVEYLKDPVSIWATVDASRQPFMLLGINSEIRTWSDGVVIDLNGHRCGAHERPNRIAAFSSIIDLSDGHFSGLSSKGAKNAHIYSSQGVGKLLRNNHFSIRGHFVKDVLIEGIQFGEEGFVNQGSYFGSAIFNDPSSVVMKDCHQVQINKAVSNSSMALSHYAQLANIEVALGYFERPSTWEASGKASYPWMKWELLAAGATDTFGNGKTTRFPVVKTEAELQTAGVPAAATARVRQALLAMQAAYRKSMKSADDTYIQVNTGHNALNVTGANRAGLGMDSLQRMSDVKQIPRSTNLIAQNPRTQDGFRYPDSVAYGVRFGSASEGVGALAVSRGGTVQDCYVMDCTFAGMHLAPMEMPTISSGSGLMKTFNGNGLRLFGYTNSLSDAASMAPALVLMSKHEIEQSIPAAALQEKPVDAFDTATKAATNSPGKGWDEQPALTHGLYKGNDVVEAGLAAVEALQLLKKYFIATAPRAVLSGVDNSNVDIGILALRKTMLDAIDASTACHIGLKGGFQGDIFQDDGTYYGYGEIYPWFVKKDGSVDIDKDAILQQAAARTDRRQTQAYLAVELPQRSDSLFRLVFDGQDTLKLVKAQSGQPVSYAECATLLGFGDTTDSRPVEYKIGRSVDGQNHVHKGAFGVRFDQTARALAQNIVIRDTEIEAKQPVQWLGSVFQQEQLGICPDTRPESGVLEIHGVSINGVTEAHVEDVLVASAKTPGTVYACEIAGKSSEITVESLRGEKLESGESGMAPQPFGDQKAIVLSVKAKSSAKVKGVKGEDLDVQHPELARVLEILSDEVEIG